MFCITIMIVCVITLILLKYLLKINFKEIKKLEFRSSEELEPLSCKFPKDEEICKDILDKLDNKNDVKIKQEPEYTTCLYTIYNNTIAIGKFKQDYMKIQTLAHECIHACQNKRLLWGNFIFSNIYLLYFLAILILTFFNKLPNSNIHTIILIFVSFIQYIIRFTLENEAMIKARYIAKEYIEEKNILKKEEESKLLEEYDKINKIGIPFMNYYLISMNIVKIIIYAFVSLI